MDPKKVLIFPAGTEIASEIQNALKFSKFVTLYGGTSSDDHSEFTYKHLIKGFPYINEEGFVDYLNKVIEEYQIDCVYPAHDSASVVFSEHADEIKAQVIITDKFTTDICRSKKDTYEFLKSESFIPKVYTYTDSIESYPVFVKPSIGQGSNGAKIINSENELKVAKLNDPSLVICEYLPGMEYTVDCFTDKNGELKVVSARNRERIKAGIAARSRSIPTDTRLIDIATTLNNKLSFKGAWFFQVKKNEQGEYRLLEISPRIPGTMGLSRNRGINFPMLTLFTFWGYDVSIMDNGYDILLDRAFYSSYRIDCEYDTVYLDFDDTLIIKNQVNEYLMRFLYQCVNKNKEIILLSKHATDIYSDLKKFKISPELFNKIIVIPQDEEKYNYVTKSSSIFIDDSFAERKRIKDNCHIAVFDVDMIECLLDWRL